MPDISSVELVEDYVFEDLSDSSFDKQDQREVLDDIDELEEHLVQWGRDITDCTTILNNTTQTIYRRRQGNFRIFFVRDGDILYCIGVGLRKRTYQRDIGKFQRRASAQLDEC
ncbi:hypothetical protein DVK01_20605 [Haloarcula sp. Atlit-120R]|nr:hypothetical protein DVK01_20605 [Haloarcula sp. Atlit-120R]